MSISELRLTRDGVCHTFKISPEVFEALESAGVLAPEEDGLFDLPNVSGAIFRFGMNRADVADRKLAAVAAALQGVLPALERLSGLADRAGLEGEAAERAMAEVSAFITAFAGLMTEATAVLSQD